MPDDGERTVSQELFTLGILILAEQGALLVEMHRHGWISVRLRRNPEFDPELLTKELCALYHYLFRPWPLRKSLANVALDVWRYYDADIDELVSRAGGSPERRFDTQPLLGPKQKISQFYREHGNAMPELTSWLQGCSREDLWWLVTPQHKLAVTPRRLHAVLRCLEDANRQRYDAIAS